MDADPKKRAVLVEAKKESGSQNKPPETSSLVEDGGVVSTLYNGVESCKYSETRFDWSNATVIGTGAFSEVIRILDIVSGEWNALKAVSKHMLARSRISNVQCVMREKRLWNMLSSISRSSVYPTPFLPLLGTFQDKDTLYFVSPLAKETLSMVSGISLDHVRSVLLFLLRATNEMHSHGVVHRDIKPAHVLIVDGGFWLCDFGCALHDSDSWTFDGTPAFIPPEQLETTDMAIYNAPESRILRRAFDYWSIGITLFWLLSHLKGPDVRTATEITENGDCAAGPFAPLLFSQADWTEYQTYCGVLEYSRLDSASRRSFVADRLCSNLCACTAQQRSEIVGDALFVLTTGLLDPDPAARIGAGTSYH